MDTIFHEKQEGSLCAQHCLNTLLQGSFFTAVDLATLAHQLDEQERTRMSEAGVDSREYRDFVSAGSQNMDDSGYFSVQVISAALRVWDLDLVRYTSIDVAAVQARRNPTSQSAYICNYRDHWFTIRRVGQQWFNLNSLLTGPELLSDSYLSEFLAQLMQEGYSIFVLVGVLPESAADRLLQLTTVSQPVKPRLISEQCTIETLAGDDPQLQAAIAAGIDSGEGSEQSEEAQLQSALAASIGEKQPQCATLANSSSPSSEMQLQLALAASLGETLPEHTASVPASGTSLEEEQLRQAIELSLQDSHTHVTVDSGEVRAQRQAFLDRLQQQRR